MSIQVDLIELTIREEISLFLRSRIRWRSIGICMETTSKLLLGATSIIAFATSVYPCNSYLSFVAGSVSTLSLVSLQFANYSFRESKLSTDNLNILLTKIDAGSLPELNGSVMKEKSLDKVIVPDKDKKDDSGTDKKLVPILKTPDTEIISTQELMNPSESRQELIINPLKSCV